ncbi:YncE family protein [Streptomyces sp. NPDC002514]|uniref:YncE family protein n=1 Tax=Streptomyces sp. NPDC001270 TaxID=3364554 RepID=UPI0036C627E7
MRRPKKGLLSLVVVSTVAVLASATGLTYAEGGFGNTRLGDKTVGRQTDGSYLTQTNQFVTPVGDVIKENGQPLGLTLNPDGKTAASLNTGGASTGIVTVFDLVHNKVLQPYGGDPGPSLADRPGGGVSDGGIVYSPDGKHLWAAQQSKLARFDVATDGTLSNEITVPLPGVDGRKAVPAGLAWAPNGTDLLVTLNANNTLGVLDTTTDTVTKQITVGNVPNSVAVIDGRAYVSNQGGRPAQPMPGSLLDQVGDVTTSGENSPSEVAANLKDRNRPPSGCRSVRAAGSPTTSPSPRRWCSTR